MSRFLIFLAALFLTLAPASAQTRYFAALDDLPMPAGFSETARGFVFEGADGRLIEAHARGAGTASACRAFYSQTLPALGWSEAPGDDSVQAFRRGRERMVILVSEAAGGREIVVRVTSRPAAMSPD